ncbi:MAG TPA: hypothetical protein VKA68_14760, partial [bacterium]|nr:hypothetical protein [bacterium]
MHSNHRHLGVAGILAGLTVVFLVMGCAGHMGTGWTRPDIEWDVHDPDRPQPPVIQPATASTQNQ